VNTNLVELERRLIAAARQAPLSDSVPYAFQRRIMARLTGRPVVDVATVWARALWRAAASCVVAVVLVSAWSLLGPRGGGLDLSLQFENTVLAAVDSEGNN
jgi:hypothetical protein